MIFLAATACITLLGICRVLHRIADDTRAIRNWYDKDQK